MLLLAAAALACQSAAPPPAASLEERDAQALGLLRAEFRRHAEAGPPRVLEAFRPAAINFHTEQSAAVPGLTYWWGSYTFNSGGTPNPGSVIPAARTFSAVRLLRTPTDWFAAASSANWRPQAPVDALTGCIEAVTTTGRSAGRGVLVYRDSFQLRSADGYMGMIAERLIKTRRLTDSHATGDTANGFVADFWMFELGQATRYRCTIRRDGFAIVATDSIEDGGFPLLK